MKTALVLAGAAVVGLVTGLAAMLGRRAVNEAAEALTGDWIDALRAEHLVVMDLLDELDLVHVSDAARRHRLLARLRSQLDKHLFEEDSVIYPALKLSGIEASTARLDGDHAKIRTQLYELETFDLDDPACPKALQALRDLLEEHFRAEEDEYFPNLRARLSPEADARLTVLFHKAGLKLA